MVISTKCGYAGLNLEIANKLYFMDPWWNPAVEDQAMGRLHRYGQENEVEATRFIIDGSIEEIINLMGNQKKLLSDFVLDSDCSKKRKKKVELLKFFRNMLNAKIKGV
jgi:SNF2 family DNA or RNA helicase